MIESSTTKTAKASVQEAAIVKQEGMLEILRVNNRGIRQTAKESVK
jgi:hypothetical protein